MEQIGSYLPVYIYFQFPKKRLVCNDSQQKKAKAWGPVIPAFARHLVKQQLLLLLSVLLFSLKSIKLLLQGDDLLLKLSRQAASMGDNQP